MGLELGHLRTFLAVYRAGSLTRAARVVHLSQPALSQQLRALEAQVGRALFVRLPRGIAATAAGHDLAREAGPHLDALEAIGDTHRAGRSGLAGTLLVGGPADLLSARVLPALAPLAAEGVSVRARTGLAGPLLETLAGDGLDLVVATTTASRLPRGLEVEPLYVETFVLVAGPVWARRIDCAAVAARGAAALAGVPLVVYAEELPIVRRYFRAVFGVRATGPIAVVVDDLRGVAGAVAAGAGISVLPTYLTDEAVARGELVPLHSPPSPPTNTIHLAARSGSYRHPRLAATRALLTRAAAGW